MLLFRYLVMFYCLLCLMLSSNNYLFSLSLSLSKHSIISFDWNRCATGESWQAVMLACKAGAECQPPAHQNRGHGKAAQKCGSDLAYGYFCSFVFLSSFLVRRFSKSKNWEIWYEWSFRCWIYSWLLLWIISIISHEIHRS